MAEVPDGQPFSYAALQSIVKHSPLLLRERFARHFRVLRNIESRLPYKFTEIVVGEDSLQIKLEGTDRDWNSFSTRPHRGRHQVAQQEDEDNKTWAYRVNLSVDRGRRRNFDTKSMTPNEKLMKEYFRKGSRVEKLWIYGKAPDILQNANINLEVDHLSMERVTPEVFHSWLRVIGDRPLKSIKFVVSAEQMFMIREPAVQACQKLRLQFPYYENNDPSFFLNLRNPEIDVIHLNLPRGSLESLIRVWVNYRVPLGTSFTLGVRYFTEVIDAFEAAARGVKTIPSKFPEITDSTCHCVTVPIDESRELVVFGEARPKSQKWPPFRWNLRIQLMKKGSTVPKML